MQLLPKEIIHVILCYCGPTISRSFSAISSTYYDIGYNYYRKTFGIYFRSIRSLVGINKLTIEQIIINNKLYQNTINNPNNKIGYLIRWNIKKEIYYLLKKDPNYLKNILETFIEKKIIKTNKYFFFSNIVIIFTELGSLEFLKWLYDLNTIIFRNKMSECTMISVTYNNLEIVKWMHMIMKFDEYFLFEELKPRAYTVEMRVWIDTELSRLPPIEPRIIVPLNETHKYIHLM